MVQDREWGMGADGGDEYIDLKQSIKRIRQKDEENKEGYFGASILLRGRFQIAFPFRNSQYSNQ